MKFEIKAILQIGASWLRQEGTKLMDDIVVKLMEV